MKKNHSVLGIILLAMGVIALLNTLNIINFSFSIWRLWPLIFLIPGLVFELNYFNNNGSVGLVIPGGILTTVGLLFMICSIFGYQHMTYLWPWFLGSVGVGLYQFYVFGDRERPVFWVSFGFLAFAVTSTVLSLLSFRGSFVFLIILIVVGLVLLKESRNKDDEPVFTFEYEKDEK
ncbi:hypothetical protein EZV73_23675 [Acidaminobacter sp. JC074]|uniref:LiaF transmembrane domain-containing protein n=1 Tax=Acidaminobacter sp. JC074 TaxID=2530199 RepID=UPI001F1001AF|nr:DUF5668 domain-containing protein [Acidaminobacter sp. JC074]MCH4890602.1 hypothetical protein [Acidaminobacter sp. JC074]